MTYINKFVFLVSFFCFSHLTGQHILNSVLADGDIYKLALNAEGIYKIDYNDIQEIMDRDPESISAANIQVFSNYGGNLPKTAGAYRPDDIIETPLYTVGLNDGSFDSGDYILFYAEGPDRLNISDGEYVYEKNIYDFKNYCFLKVGSQPGKRISKMENYNVSAYRDYYTRIIRYEDDRVNLLGDFPSTHGSGKLWFGSEFTNDREQTFSNLFRLANPVIGSEARFEVRFAGRSDNPSRVEVIMNGQTFSTSINGTDLGEIESTYAFTKIVSGTSPITGNPELDINFISSEDESKGWLDYIQLTAEEYISVSNTPLIVQSKMNHNTEGYSFTYTGTDLQIWSIGSLENVASVDYDQQGNNIDFGIETDNEIHKFVIFREQGDFLSPELVSKIENQNLHGIERADMVVVYHQDFIASAERFAAHRSEIDGFRIELIDVEEIYNEFGGGKSDAIAVRDFARMLHLRDENFRYMLFLGDATYDYRGITDLAYTNFVPTYQTDNSLAPIYAFPTDDFFALLDDGEGSNDIFDGDLDIAIGRIPSKTADEANAVVNKIIHYETATNRYDDWRMKLGFAADDVDASWDTTHLLDSEKISVKTQENYSCMLQQKVYFDAFVQEATPGGARYPDANRAISDNIFKGQLVFNYLGHGGPKGLSQERVIQIDDVANWNNFDRLPVFVTATCSFTSFDDPDIVSAGEHLILNPNGGAVGVFTTVRSVFASSNFLLTDDLFDNLFAREKGKSSRLGDIMIRGKNLQSNSTERNSRKFLLMGDPSLRIAVPEHKVAITSFNGEPIQEGQLDTIGALGRSQIAGSILDFETDNLLSSFNGEIKVTILDKSRKQKTLVNDGNGRPLEFEVRNNILYKGRASVTNGEFVLDIILPKDIDYAYGLGAISMYATDGKTVDASGCYERLVIGGDSPSLIVDTEGPEVNIFFDDRSFEFGGLTSKEPKLIVDLKDENGINLSSSSIGHDITATLEDPNGDKIILNEFFKPTLDKTGEGTVTYQMEKLEPGPHKLYVKAWDILNNSTEEVIEFVVEECKDGTIDKVYNYPNPFSTNTDFTFQHDLVNTDVDIVISIYSLSGKLLKSIVDSRFSSGGFVSDIGWDGKDDYGSKLAKGIYLYKIQMRSPTLNQSRESDFSKLVILN